MRKTRRKIKKEKKRIKNTIIIIFCFLLALSGFGVYLYWSKTSTSLFVSPIAVDYDILTPPKSENSIDLLSEKLRDKDIEFEKIEKDASSFVILLKNKAIVIISRDKDLDLQIASLQFILTRLTMEGKTFSSLDLRFDKPVIKE